MRSDQRSLGFRVGHYHLQITRGVRKHLHKNYK